MTFDGVFGSLEWAQAMTQQAISAGNVDRIWTLEPDGTLDYQGTPLPNTAITGLNGTAQNAENTMTSAWSKALKDSGNDIDQSVKDMLAAQQAATKLNNQLSADIQAVRTQLATATSAAKISQLQTQLTQLLKDQQNLLNEQELLAQIEATKLRAAAQKLQPGPKGPTGTGPTGTGPTGTGPTGTGPTGAGPTGTGPTGPPVYTVGTGPSGVVSTAYNPNGASNGASSTPMMMPMPMPMGGMGGMGSPMSGMNDLSSQSGATGPQGSNVLADQAGPTGATAQDVSAINAGGTGAKPPGASAGTVPASTNAVPASAGTVPASSLRSAGNSAPAGLNTDPKPDGTTAPASSMQPATAARAAQRGGTSADAGRQAGMALPPLGALNRKSDRAGKNGDQRGPGVERPAGDDDQDSDHSRRQ
jgi:hypothetical protein